MDDLSLMEMSDHVENSEKQFESCRIIQIPRRLGEFFAGHELHDQNTAGAAREKAKQLRHALTRGPRQHLRLAGEDLFDATLTITRIFRSQRD